jgi:hypothetical protein
MQCIFEHVDDMTLSDKMHDMDIESDDESSDDEESKSTEDISYLVSALRIRKPKKHGQSEYFKKWCGTVSENKMPLDNICYLLFLDVVEWFSKPTTAQMRYFQNETRQFWEVGYGLFRGIICPGLVC